MVLQALLEGSHFFAGNFLEGNMKENDEIHFFGDCRIEDCCNFPVGCYELYCQVKKKLDERCNEHFAFYFYW